MFFITLSQVPTFKLALATLFLLPQPAVPIGSRAHDLQELARSCLLGTICTVSVESLRRAPLQQPGDEPNRALLQTLTHSTRVGTLTGIQFRNTIQISSFDTPARNDIRERIRGPGLASWRLRI